jgi:hypothetical protein
MIQAIETVYNGHRFRSRLEARWAVFFDVLDVPYEYEPEGFDIDGTRYLPDFWLPTWECWAEVKPRLDMLSVVYKAVPPLKKLVTATQKDGLLLSGIGWSEEPADLIAWCRMMFIDKSGDEDCYGEIGKCRRCDGYWLLDPMDGRGRQIGPHNPDAAKLECGINDCFEREPLRMHEALTPHLFVAYEAAMQARFEHGEKPLLPRNPLTATDGQDAEHIMRQVGRPSRLRAERIVRP